ncbi:MAG: glutamate--tRNA ligase [Actinomycetota bacterium]
MNVRVRIAPAPTGTLHIGNARTALYNWLFARRHNGTFVLRIEDTDQARAKQEFVDSVTEELRWLGLGCDEGPGVGGPVGPYRQSERLATYRQAAFSLEEEGLAYRCFCTPEELDERRREAQAERRRPGYDGRCYRLTEAQKAGFESEGRRWVMRFHVPEEGETTFDDVVTGPVTWRHSEIDDFAIFRQDGFPIYNFGVAMDDALMEITHVIRGMDIQSSTPRQILVMNALGYQQPVYAHIPLVMGPGGKKLSKRLGGGSIEWYREHGFLPEALINSLVLLGTGFGDETILSRDEMVAGFELEKVNASPANFDLAKLDWMNGEYIRAQRDLQFAESLMPWLAGAGLVADPPAQEQGFLVESLAPLIKTRIRRLEEAAHYARPVLGDAELDQAAFEKVMRHPHVQEQMQRSIQLLAELADWSRDNIEEALRQVQMQMELKPKTAFAPFYVSVTGSTVSAPIFDVMALVGKQECLSRLRQSVAKLGA